MLEHIIAVLKVWKWPEYAMKWRVRWHEMKAARANRVKAEKELREFERDAPARERIVQAEDFKVRVDKAKTILRNKHVSRVTDESDEVNAEAIRQIRDEATKNWRR